MKITPIALITAITAITTIMIAAPQTQASPLDNCTPKELNQIAEAVLPSDPNTTRVSGNRISDCAGPFDNNLFNATYTALDSLQVNPNGPTVNTPQPPQPPGTGGPTPGDIGAGIAAAGITGGATVQETIQNVVNILLFIIGALAVIMIIIGGIKYTSSAGDQSKAASAKTTIMFSVVGLIIAALAAAIVNFVMNNIINAT